MNNNPNKLNAEEQESYTEYTDGMDKLHCKITKDTNKRVRDTCTTKTFWAGMFLMFVLTTAYHWNLGYPITSRIGAVPSGTLSGKAQYEELEHARIVIANQKQRQQRMIESNKTLRESMRDVTERSHNAELNVARLETEAEQRERWITVLKNENAELKSASRERDMVIRLQCETIEESKEQISDLKTELKKRDEHADNKPKFWWSETNAWGELSKTQRIEIRKDWIERNLKFTTN